MLINGHKKNCSVKKRDQQQFPPISWKNFTRNCALCWIVYAVRYSLLQLQINLIFSNFNYFERRIREKRFSFVFEEKMRTASESIFILIKKNFFWYKNDTKW